MRSGVIETYINKLTYYTLAERGTAKARGMTQMTMAPMRRLTMALSIIIAVETQRMWLSHLV